MEKLLRSYIKDYKQYSVGIILICIALFIVAEVVLPEWNSIQQKEQEIATKTQTMQNLKTTVDTINSSNTQDIADKLKIVSSALPNGKDIVSIYNAITNVAAKSSITINSFALQVGDVYGKSKNSSSPLSREQTPSLAVQVSVHSDDGRSVFEFSKQLYQVLPLAEIKTLQIADGDGTFAINFYYKPYDANIIAQQQNVTPLTTQELKALSDLENWQNNSQH